MHYLIRRFRNRALHVRLGNIVPLREVELENVKTRLQPTYCSALRYYPGEAFYQAIARHEHYLSAQMGLKPGMRVLDVGCGVGGPAREIARFSGAEVIGVNNNQFQVNIAKKLTAKAGLSNQVDFVKGDFMGLSELFGEGSFDAVYAIEATVHAPNFEGIYGEIQKVLKPGGTVSSCRPTEMRDLWLSLFH